jgi:beta-lactamase superfamily II metal-dependent hydrolase
MKQRKLLLAFIILMTLLLASCGSIEVVMEPVEQEQGNPGLEVHFIDVGQGDAILVKTPMNENILIDAGGNDDEERVVDYLRNQGVESLKAVVGTHPHEDHIGGLDRVIDNFSVEKVYMPKVVHDTKTFEDVLDAVDGKGLKITRAISGEKLDIEGVQGLFLAPIADKYKELNNYSAVIRLQYEDTVFLFTGDAEALVEEEMLRNNPLGALKAHVLKVGHHGSYSSTSEPFLEAVAPEYAVIQLGKDNKYGHPHRETMDKLKAKGIQVLRTDTDGTVIFKSDGQKIQVLKGE